MVTEVAHEEGGAGVGDGAGDDGGEQGEAEGVQLMRVGELGEFQHAGGEDHGGVDEEGEFGGFLMAHTTAQCADDGGTPAGNAGQEAKHWERPMFGRPCW